MRVCKESLGIKLFLTVANNNGPIDWKENGLARNYLIKYRVCLASM